MTFLSVHGTQRFYYAEKQSALQICPQTVTELKTRLSYSSLRGFFISEVLFLNKQYFPN